MQQKEALLSVVQRLKESRIVKQAGEKKQAATEEVSGEEKELVELQGFLSPIFETITNRLSLLQEVGVLGLIDEMAGIYGKEKTWEQERQMEGIPLSTLRNWATRDPSVLLVNPWLKDLLGEETSGSSDYTRGVSVPNLDWSTRAENQLRGKYPNKLKLVINDPGSYVDTKILFSKIAVSPEPQELGLAVLDRDVGGGEGINVDGWISFETRRGLYKKAAKKQKQLGLKLEVVKRVVDDQELEGIDRSKFHHQLSPVLYEVTRRIDFIVFEKNPNNIIISPHGYSKEKVFDLRSKTAIGNLRAYLGEVIAGGGDISAMEHKLPYINRGAGAGWAGKG